ncbi:hypothetical protein KC321_g18 [Hortaea werneckii]|nr:hypothetical protein KC321_g18 [Hortaea werneckii]
MEASASKLPPFAHIRPIPVSGHSAANRIGREMMARIENVSFTVDGHYSNCQYGASVSKDPDVRCMSW